MLTMVVLCDHEKHMIILIIDYAINHLSNNICNSHSATDPFHQAVLLKNKACPTVTGCVIGFDTTGRGALWYSG